MKIGFPANILYDHQGKAKTSDGIGNYTHCLEQALINKQVDLQQVYFHGLRTRVNGEAFPYPIYPALKPTLGNLLPWDAYKHLAKHMDLLHVTDYLSPVTKSLPVISTLHDAIMIKNPEWTEPNPLRFRLKKYILRHCAKHTDHIITISQAVVNDIAEYFQVPHEKISVVYSGVDDIWFHPIEEQKNKQILQKHNLENTNFLLTVGTLQPRKNVENIVAAFQKLSSDISNDLKLIIVGQSLPGLTPSELISKIKQYEAQGKIKWLKYVDFETLRCLYQNASIFLFPSLAEGFGLPILEAFASKTPVITSNFGATKEIAGNAGYLIDPYDIGHLASAIETLLQASETYQHYVSEGYQRAKQFTWEKCAEETKKVYKKVLQTF
jgi:alpha-1,3-rhamnosyl/mannosyltransferase